MYPLAWEFPTLASSALVGEFWLGDHWNLPLLRQIVPPEICALARCTFLATGKELRLAIMAILDILRCVR